MPLMGNMRVRHNEWPKRREGEPAPRASPADSMQSRLIRFVKGYRSPRLIKGTYKLRTDDRIESYHSTFSNY